jgi:ABC-type uncharacterized transport system substrate-binding protein
MRRREFITLLGGVAAAWPVTARAQQRALPVVGFISGRSPDDSARPGAAFRAGLSESGIIDGQTATVDYHWLDGQYDQLPTLVADLVRRRVAVIVTPGIGAAARVAKSATKTIPIVFGVGQDPVQLGLVASLARPGGNVTGINFFASEVVPKQLGLLHELVPKAVRLAVLVNPSNASAVESNFRTFAKPHPRSGSRFRWSRRPPSGRSTLSQARSRTSGPTLCSSGPTPFCSADGFSLRSWRRGTGFQQWRGMIATGSKPAN